MWLSQLLILAGAEMKALWTTQKSGINQRPETLMLLFLNALLTRL